jgi:hypothetical protein
VMCMHWTFWSIASCASLYLPLGGPVVTLSKQSPSLLRSQGHWMLTCAEAGIQGIRVAASASDTAPNSLARLVENAFGVCLVVVFIIVSSSRHPAGPEPGRVLLGAVG